MNLELDYLPFYVFVDKHFDIAAILFCNLMFAVYITCCQPQAVQQTLVLAAYAVPLALSTLTGYIQYIMTISYTCTTMIESDSFFNMAVALISVFMYLLLIWKGGNTSLQCAMK